MVSQVFKNILRGQGGGNIRVSQVSLGGNEIILKLIMVRVVQLYKYTEEK